METSKQQEMKGSTKVSNLMLRNVLLLAAENPEHAATECMTMAAPVSRVPSTQTHSSVGGPRNEPTILEPEALQVPQLFNLLQLQAQ